MSSEHASILKIMKNDVINLYPSESIRELKITYKVKDNGRELFQNKSSTFNKNSAIEHKDKGVEIFPLASSQAKNRLI